MSKPLLPKLGGAWTQNRAAGFSHCHASAPAAGGQPSWPEIEASYPKSVSCVTAGVIPSLGPRRWDGWWYAGVINNTGWGMLPGNWGFLHTDFWGQRDLQLIMSDPTGNRGKRSSPRVPWEPSKVCMVKTQWPSALLGRHRKDQGFPSPSPGECVPKANQFHT